MMAETTGGHSWQIDELITRRRDAGFAVVSEIRRLFQSPLCLVVGQRP
jgi:hypothetical protein